MVGEGDKVATRVTIRSEEAETWTGIGITRIDGAQIVEQWADTDAVASSAE